MLIRLLGFAALVFSTVTLAQVTTVTDVLGRQVSFDAPAQRVIVGFYPEDYMAIGTEAAYDHVVGMSKYIWQARPANWALYVKHRPSLAQIPGIGRVDTKTFSVEKVIGLHPDLLMLADWQYKGLGADIERIEQAGIPVVVVDYNAQTLERHIKSTQLIGVITGQQARAEKIANEYRQQSGHDPPTLSHCKFTQASKFTRSTAASGVNEIGYTFGKNMRGAIATMAEAIIFPPFY
ncbi:ABC transporter substrate-binding protein [Vibrio sp. PP-XX7]